MEDIRGVWEENHREAIIKLMSELQRGEDSVRNELDWISQEDIMREFFV